jgi:alcohol dehydrogenase class IV
VDANIATEEKIMINILLTPSCISIGGGAIGEITSHLRHQSIQNPLCVVDPNLLRLGVATPVFKALECAKLPVAVFDKVVEEPTDVSVNAAAHQVVEGEHDGVIGIGGGSSIDTAKAAAIVASLDEKIIDLKVPRIVDEMVYPVIAVPTTAGSGSEVTRACVVANTTTKEKMLILGMACLPAGAIVDFELSFSCPFQVTAHTGIDALTHALESVVNSNRNPHSDALALSALRLIGENLELACHEPSNRAAREAMMMGAMHAGMAVSTTSTALVHGMSRPLGALFGVPHGLSNAMMLPVVCEFSAAAAPALYATCARALGWADAGSDDTIAVVRLQEGLKRLNRTLNVPSPAAFGIDHDSYFSKLDEMTKQALASGTPNNNLRVPSAEEIKGIYRQAWEE